MQILFPFLSFYCFLSLSLSQELKILYSYLDNGKENAIAIYSDGQYNELFLPKTDAFYESSPYYKLLFSNCQENSGLIIPTSENSSHVIIKNLERNSTFALSVITDLENHELMNPKLNFSNESMILPANGKFEFNMIFDCNNETHPKKPWSKVFFDLQVSPFENDTVNENLTKNYAFSFIKFCSKNQRSYWSLVFLLTTALIIVYFSTRQPPIMTDAPETQEIQPIHAFLFVIFGSLLLTILYFFLPYLVTALFLMVILTGLSSLTVLFTSIFEKYGPQNLNVYLGNIPYYGLIKAHEFISLLISIAICLLYVMSRNWILNNLIGISFVFLLIRTIRMPNYFVALLMLGFAFFYDIFWVFYSSHFFGQSVMAYVATNLNLPMKIICPTLTDSPLNSCSLLGLGDMALPGFFIAYCFYFDKIKNIKVYHIVCILSYGFALILCLICLVFFNSAQPALLYISPCLLISVAVVGWKRGEFNELWLGLVDEKYEKTQKRVDRIMTDIKKKDEDDCLEIDKEEHYYNHGDNSLFETKKEEV